MLFQSSEVGYPLTIQSHSKVCRTLAVYGLRKFDHVSQSRKAAEILPIKNIFKLQVACLVHKILLSGRPPYLKCMLQARSEVRERCTRQDSMLEVPKVRLELGRNAFSYFAPQM
uniref:Uncharacterized protein n=1 Tax=Cuerna arida TaxID=1464854 RepID=A0A1B6ESK4_9HEMI